MNVKMSKADDILASSTQITAYPSLHAIAHTKTNLTPPQTKHKAERQFEKNKVIEM
jgi:hypothetical protein